MKYEDRYSRFWPHYQRGQLTHYRKLEPDESAAPVPEDDFIAVAGVAMHYFSVDTSGGLAWEMNSISYLDTTAYVVQILSGKTSNAYKDYLRRNSVSRIIGGKHALDLQEAARKISSVFGVGEIMLNGGVRLNWSFIQAGLCNEVNIVLAPAADGRKGAQTLFEADARLQDMEAHRVQKVRE